MRTIIFYDFDNTLMLTSLADRMALESVFGEYIHSGLVDFDRDLSGRDIGDVCRKLNEELGLSLDETTIRQQFRAAFFEHLQHVQPTPGTAEFTAQTSASAGVSQFIVSNSPKARIQPVLAHLEQSRDTAHFNRIFSSDYIFTPFDNLAEPIKKPRPDIYIHAVEQVMVKFGLYAHQANYTLVEDSVAGVRAAHAAKMAMAQKHPGLAMTIIGFVGDRLIDHHAKQTLEQASNTLIKEGADQIIDDMRQLDSVLNPPKYAMQ